MELDPKTAALIAQHYVGAIEPLTRLGWGIGGFVFLSPNLHSAVKVHRYRDGFERELETYQRLARLKISKMLGLTIPKLQDYQRIPDLIRMDFVSPPFLLDFAGVAFSPPDFEADVMADWHAGLHERFAANVSIAYAVYTALAQHGIYYM